MSRNPKNYTLFTAEKKAEHYSRLNRKYNQRKAVDVLIGIALGILADGEINSDEAAFLNDWLKTNLETIPTDIIEALQPHLSAIEANTFDPENSSAFVECLFQLVGQPDHVTDQPEAELMGKPSQMFFAEIEASEIIFEDHEFVLTGTFDYGQKSTIEELVIARQASTNKNRRKTTDYLVIGQKGSTDWRHSNYGSKIDKVLSFREKGATILIIPEQLLLDALNVL